MNDDNLIITDSALLINLSFLLAEPTGISTYAANVFPYLKKLDPTLLTAHHYPEFNCHSIPNNLTPAREQKVILIAYSGHNSNYLKFINNSKLIYYSHPFPKLLYIKKLVILSWCMTSSP